MLCGVLYRTLNNHIRSWRVPSEQEKRKKTELVINCLWCYSFNTALYNGFFFAFSGLLPNTICGVSVVEVGIVPYAMIVILI